MLINKTPIKAIDISLFYRVCSVVKPYPICEVVTFRYNASISDLGLYPVLSFVRVSSLLVRVALLAAIGVCLLPFTISPLKNMAKSLEYAIAFIMCPTSLSWLLSK